MSDLNRVRARRWVVSLNSFRSLHVPNRQRPYEQRTHHRRVRNAISQKISVTTRLRIAHVTMGK